MKGLNKVMLIGNVGNQPDVKTLSNNNIVAKFSLATSETYTNKEGIKNTETTWHKIIAWNSLATVIENYVSKGSLLHIQGKINNRQYNDEQNNTHYITEIVADEIILLDKKNNTNGNNYPTE
jgi:single-strand DNA-binding protein